MSGLTILDQLVDEYRLHSSRARHLREAEYARRERDLFCRLYDPADIDQCLRSRQQAENFVSRLYNELRPLCGLNFFGGTGPYRAAADKRDRLASLLRLTFASKRPVFQRVDLPWNDIPWFGGEDRQIPKKILCTYFPQQTLPILKTEHLEHFVQHLALRDVRDDLARDRFGVSYGDRLSCGQKWDVLSETLLSEKKRHPEFKSDEDSVYFMYSLYHTSARPPGF